MYYEISERERAKIDEVNSDLFEVTILKYSPLIGWNAENDTVYVLNREQLGRLIAARVVAGAEADYKYLRKIDRLTLH